jgi:hypothetical protein
MNAAERDPFARLTDAYRATHPPDEAERTRLMTRLAAAAPPVRGATGAWAVIAAAAVLLAVTAAVIVPRVWPRASATRTPQAIATAVPIVQFELAAPGAARVALVGDFNDWDRAATPMRRDRSGDRWTVTLPVSAGRHVYAFVVDGERWVGDPLAPRAPEDGFGAPGSVVVVSAGETAS